MGRIDVRTEDDQANDVTLVYTAGLIENEQDCRDWLARMREIAARHDRFAYWVSLLHMFSTTPEMLYPWAVYAAEFTKGFNGLAIAVGCDAGLASLARLSPEAPSFIADDIPGALKRIEKIRASKTPERHMPRVSEDVLKKKKR